MNAVDYFQSYEKYFWVWEEDAEVLTISGGSTIAYTDEMTTILSEIAENGLPPFGAILLAIIAINKTDDDSLDFVYEIFSKFEFSDDEKDNCLKIAFDFLRLLQSMPIAYRTGQRKQILLRTIFGNAHNRVSIATSGGVVVRLKLKQRKDVRGISRQAVLTKKKIVKDLRVLELLYRKFTTIASIIDAMGDLPEIDEALIPSLDTKSVSPIHYNDFVEELMANAQTFPVGALIKPIWAGFKVPIFNAHPSEQPLGGVSDLSNKGDFDKLLVAEFANDDLIFMSRLANNEALYLHREMPPVTDKLQRIMLIDVSLKTWGVPKILAHATSLAISKHPKSKTESKVFVVGNEAHLIDYENIGTIIDGLQTVAVGLNASIGLASFLNENKQNKQLEIFYITTAEGLKYPEISKILTENHTLFKYIITTNAEGNIHFYRNKTNAFKHLQTIILPLDKLWKKPIKKIDTNIEINRPTNEQLPILLPLPSKISRIIPIGKEIYFVANKCLYRKVILNEVSSNKGGELILQNVPNSIRYEIGKTAEGQLFFLSFNPQNREIVITDLTTLQSAKTNFHEWKSNFYAQFIFLGDKFTCLVRNPDVFTFTPNFETKTIEINKEENSSGLFSVDYHDRQKEIDGVKTSFPTHSFNILKNLKEVCIDHEGLLTFNEHTLLRSSNSTNFFYNCYYKADKIPKAKAAYNVAKKAFLFSDGSEIKVNEKGYFELISSNKNIPTLYIPSTIDNGFGVATNTHFAGLDYFYKIPYLTYKVHSCGTEKLSAVKILKNYSGLGLADAKGIIDNAPTQFSVYSNIKDAMKMTKELRAIGCEIKLLTNTTQQTIMSPPQFYDKFIQGFINQIIA